MPTNWEQIKRLFCEALKVKPDERASFLADACPDEISLRNEIESLLTAYGEADEYMESPALDGLLTSMSAADTVASGTAAWRIASGGVGTLLPLAEEGRYEFGRESARGGLGRILEARDVRLNRAVAVKELLDGGINAELRLIREALITARLQHPSIVPIYDLARNSKGKPFYSMKFVSGSSLAEMFRERKTLAERLALLPNVIAVADAASYAHEQRIVHRDLKPANVLIGAFGETVVIDWGLAVDLRESNPSPTRASHLEELESARLTQAGTIMGTPKYMPPEQAEGKPVDERADVYAIGAMLYQLLAGQPPYEGNSSKEVLASIAKYDPVPLETRQPGVAKELAAIVRKAMTRNVEERYRTAKELADDLKRFQRGQLVSAHSYSRWEQSRRWARKRRIPVTIALVLSLIIAATGSASILNMSRGRNWSEQVRLASEARRPGQHSASVNRSGGHNTSHH